MSGNPLKNDGSIGFQGATVPGPADFPLGSTPSRAAARFRLQGIALAGQRLSDCICFPENEPPFFCSPDEEVIAAKVKCPLHGDRFKQTSFHIYVSQWRIEKEPLRRQRLSQQYQKAWAASSPSDL